MMNPESDDQNIPKGLDDLLDSIRGESERQDSSALAVYVPDQREEDLVSEQIDERILALLGLEDVVDIDYATYKTLLREKMMEGRMADSKMPSDEVELLTNEFKRVKGNTGRFKVKKQKINFESFVDDVRPQETSEQTGPQEPLLALPGTAQVKPPDVEVAEEEKEDKFQGIEKFLGGMSERLEKIEKNLSDMLDMEAKNVADEKKEVDAERIAGEKTKKRKRESSLEKGIKGIGKSITEKVTKPVKGFFEQLLNFFLQIFLGSAVLGLIKLLENPMMIFNPLINLVNGVIGMINNILNFLFGGLVDPVNSLVGLLNGGITNLENTINGVMGLFGEQEEEDKLKFPKIPEAKVPQIPKIPLFEPKEEKPKEEPVKGMAGGGLVVNEGPTINVKQEVGGYTEGGQVTNQNVGGYNEGGRVINQNVGGYTEGGQVTNLNLGSIGGWKGGNMTISPRVSGFKGGGEIKPTYNFLSPITNLGYTGGGSVTNNTLGYTGGGSVTNTSILTSNTSTSTSPLNVSNFRYEGGGSITSSSGQTITGMGPDTQLIAAQPGEIVMSKKAVQAYGANNLLAMNKDAGGTNVPTMGSIRGFSGGGMIEVQGTGNTVEGTLKMKDASGKQVGKTYSAISGTYAGMNVAQDKRAYTRNAPMPDGTYKLLGFQEHGPYPGLPGIGHWSTYVNNGGGSIGSRSGLMLHNDIGSNGTLGCIGVELGGVAGTKAEQEFLQTYKQVNPQSIKVALGGGSGDASEVSPVSSRPATPDNSIKASISSPTPRSTPGPPPSKSSGSIVALPGGSQKQQPSQSSTSAGQKEVPSFSSRDMGNTEFIVIKSIYNIVG